MTNKSSPVVPLIFLQDLEFNWQRPGKAGTTLHLTSTTLLYKTSGVTTSCHLKKLLRRYRMYNKIILSTDQIEDIRPGLVSDED